jgi:hypothetical protein
MIDIKKLIVARIKGDSTIQTLMGGTTTDPRIYPYYGGTATISATLPAYITYSLLSNPEATGAVENPVYSLTIWAKDWTTAEGVAAQVKVLFNKKKLTAPATNRILWSKQVYENDQMQEASDFKGIALHYRFGFEETGT